MKIARKLTVFAFAAVLAASAADDVVSNIKCQQRWPWNGKVDISYTLKESDSSLPVYSVKFYANINGSDVFEMLDIVGDGSCGIVIGAGAKTVTWDSNASGRAIDTTNMKVGVVAKEITDEAAYLRYNIASKTMSVSSTLTKATMEAAQTGELWFRRVEPGAFEMGSPEDETGHFNNNNNEVLHTVTITKAYYIGVFELTQGQFVRLFGENISNSGNLDPNNTFPLTNVSYVKLRGENLGTTWPQYTDYRVDAGSILGKLRALANNSFIFDLPTEAQWEKACRAGTTTAWNNGTAWLGDGAGSGLSNSDLDDLGWYTGNGGSLHQVGLKTPNALGLYDMHGNVWEWCLDRYADNITALTLDPVGPETGNDRVIRGGAYNEWAIRSRSGRRMHVSKTDCNPNRGVRLCIVK